MPSSRHHGEQGIFFQLIVADGPTVHCFPHDAHRGATHDLVTHLRHGHKHRFISHEPVPCLAGDVKCSCPKACNGQVAVSTWLVSSVPFSYYNHMVFCVTCRMIKFSKAPATAKRVVTLLEKPFASMWAPHQAC